MAIDSKSLTIDSKKLLKAASTETPKQKVSAAAQLASLTPTQYAKLFPQHYNKTVEREAAASGKVASRGVSGGVPGTTERNPGPVGGSGGARSAVSQGRTGSKKRGVSSEAPVKPESWQSQLRRDREQASGEGLQSLRSRQMKELEDPKVRSAVLARAEIEVGSQPQAQQAWLESVFNRAAADKLSLYDAVSNDKKHRYYPEKDNARWRRMTADVEGTNKTLGEKFGGHLNVVGGGSNITDYATDNSSADVADSKRKKYPDGKTIGGEFFNSDKGRRGDWAKEQRRIAEEEKQTKPTEATPSTLPEGISADIQKHYDGLKNDVEKENFRKDIYHRLNKRGVTVEAINKMAETPPPIQSTSITPAPTDKTKSLIEQYPEGTERFFRSRGKTDGLNPKLVDVMREASKDLPPGYRVEMFSGKDGRKSGTTNHPGGVAIDLAIVDSNGKKLSPNGFGEGHKAYEQLAQSMRLRGQEKYPGTEYIWGGAWKSSAAGYGDRMHYQIKDPDQPVPGASRTSGQYSMDKGIPENYPESSSFMTPKELSEYKAKIAAKVLEERKFAREAPSASRQVASTQPAAPQAPLPMNDRSIVAGRTPPAKTAAPTATPKAPPPQVAPTTPKPTPQAGSMLSATQTQAPQVATPAPTNNDPGGSYDAPKEPPKDVPKMATGGEFQAGEPLVVADKRTGKIRAQINENETLDQKDKRVTVTPNHKTNPDDLVEKSEKKTERVEDDSDNKTKASNVTPPPPQASMRNGVSSSKPNWTDITQGSANPYHWNSFEKAMNRTGGRPPTYNDSTIKT